VLSAISPRCFLYKNKSAITSKIAALSYGIYLIHKILIHVTQTQFTKFKIDDNSNLMFLICVLTVFIASLILNEVIEKPFLNLRKKIIGKEVIKNKPVNKVQDYV
jgi:peptidoglycan/LPS O-acetylase OafA/YrhL